MTTQRTTLDRTGAPRPLEFAEEQGEWAMVRYDSVAAMLEHAMARLPEVNENDYIIEGCHGRDRDADKLREWYGLDSTEAVVAALVDGHEPGVSMVEELAAQMPQDVAPPTATRRRRRWGEAGDSVDMQRVWAGSLDRAWQRTAPTEVRAPKVIRLMVMLNALAEVSASTVAWRGVAALALTRILSARGYAVEIVGCLTSSQVYNAGWNGPQHLATEVLLKQAQKPLDLTSLCGPMTVMGFFRHAGFLIRAHGSTPMRKHFGVSVRPENTPFWNPDFIGGFDKCVSAATAAEFVRAALATIQDR